MNAKSEGGGTALMRAAMNMFAKSKAGYNRTGSMNDARYNSNPEVIELLLKNGADINATSDNGMTILMAAGLNSHPKNISFISYLLKNGADVNAKDKFGRTALMRAASYNSNPEVISLLLENGADARMKCKDGKKAIDYAGVNGALKNTEVFRQLQGASPSSNTKTVQNNKKPSLSSNTAVIQNNDSVVAQDFLDPNAKDEADEAKAAIENSAYANTRDNDAVAGRTALIRAAESDPNPETIARLFRNGADINARDGLTGGTALMWAAESNPNPEVILLLLENGADVHMKDWGGRRAIDYAGRNSKLRGTKAFKQLQEATGRR
ncbi:hypothetical protein FACS1894204_11850 [Synergistales bacterium]|nr:hypothetical protein FACS1894204_11850 [Synergistales bacterium]